MKVVFRVDASLQIGTGHVMRCLTLADALAARSVECLFICRAHEGNLIDFIRDKGYATHALQVGAAAPKTPSLPSHASWLGATQTEDIEACLPILAAQRPDWLIVDHYALDANWEQALQPYYRKLLAIDDLADRPHACDLLLDQTFGRETADYRPLVPSNCRVLCGSQYALLRPEFAAMRPYSLQRRAKPTLRELLITMGGVDADNATGQVLDSLRACPLPADIRVTVVMGAMAPWLNEVRKQAQNMPWPTRVLVGVNNMAQLMADSDLAIGAAGATSWERCCLGLPSVLLVLAQNQSKIAEGLSNKGAAHLIIGSILKEQFSIAFKHLDCQTLEGMSDSAAEITDGLGVTLVIETLLHKDQYAN